MIKRLAAVKKKWLVRPPTKKAKSGPKKVVERGKHRQADPKAPVYGVR